MTALIVGTVLALAALTFVLYPLLIGVAEPARGSNAMYPVSGGSQDQAIDALREIEFDRATGKLSDTDYASLKASYTQQAVEAMRSGNGPVCDVCGPRPEADARFCSNCGRALA
ncbi:MAG TPA: hypothetical protein VJL35_07440 [Gemmatimonadaceae bacterium]|nr:hypothetical protein [Gemmatimonadaceae bacterium]